MERIFELGRRRLRSVFFFLQPKKIVAAPTAILIGMVVSFAGAAIGVVTSDVPGPWVALQAMIELLPLTSVMIFVGYFMLLGLRELQSNFPKMFGPIFYLSNLTIAILGLFLRQQHRVDGVMPEAWNLFSNQVGFIVYLYFLSVFLQLVIGGASARLQFENQRANTALSELERQHLLLLRGQEQVRRELARFLHDGLQSTLVVLGMQIQRVTRDVPTQAQDVLRAAISELEQLRSIDVRSAIDELSPDLSQTPVSVSLGRLVRKYEGVTEVMLEFDPACSRADLDADLKLAIYRIVEQGLLNAVRHGNSRSITVTGYLREESLTLEIAGAGDAVPESFTPGVGLSVIDGWCKVYRGSWELSSSQGITSLNVVLDTTP